MGERATCPQIMFGATNFKFCPIENVAISLESLFPTEENQHGAVNQFVFRANTLEKIQEKDGSN